MAYQVRWDRLAFQKTKIDDPRLPDGPEDIVMRGGLVPDYVPLSTISALSNSGMIVYVDEPDPLLVPFETLPEQPRMPEQPVVLPSNPNSVPEVLGGPDVVVEPDDDEPPALPKDSDKKEVWEGFAPTVGLTQADAESMTKADLMTEVKARYGQQYA